MEMVDNLFELGNWYDDWPLEAKSVLFFLRSGRGMPATGSIEFVQVCKKQ